MINKVSLLSSLRNIRKKRPSLAPRLSNKGKSEAILGLRADESIEEARRFMEAVLHMQRGAVRIS